MVMIDDALNVSLTFIMIIFKIMVALITKKKLITSFNLVRVIWSHIFRQS